MVWNFFVFFCFWELNVSLARDLVSHWQSLHALGATWRILLPTNFFFAIRTYSDTKSVTDKLGQYNRANHSQSTNEPPVLINKTLFFQWINAYCVDLNTTPTQNESAGEWVLRGGSSLQFQWFVKWCKLTHKTSCQLYYIWHYHRFHFHLQGKSKNRAIRAYCGDNKDVFSQCVGLVCASPPPPFSLMATLLEQCSAWVSSWGSEPSEEEPVAAAKWCEKACKVHFMRGRLAAWAACGVLIICNCVFNWSQRPRQQLL